MGEVQIKYKVMPDSSTEGVDIENVVESIKALPTEVGEIQLVELKPLAFGLQYAEATIIIEDGEGTVDTLEEKLNEIHGVGEVQVLEMGRLL